MLAKADEAASSLLSAVRDVRTALIKADLARATGKEPLDELPIGPVMGKIEKVYTQTREYHARARVAVGNLSPDWPPTHSQAPELEKLKLSGPPANRADFAWLPPSAQCVPWTSEDQEGTI